jgi:ketosteroid isomerase-like protein
MRKWTRSVTPVILLLSCCASCGRHLDATTEVRAAIMAFGTAYSRADTATLRTLLAADYVHVNGGSGATLDRERWLDWIGTRRAKLEAGTLQIRSYELTDLDVRVHGQAVVATGTVHATGVEDGTPFASRLRFTNVWVYEEGRWRRAAFHDSPVPDGEESGS